jgi:SAM-dependent methyltransferase
MRIKNLLKSYTPHLHDRLSRGRSTLRLIVSILQDPDIDFGLINDTLKKSHGTYDLECPLCGFIGYFKAFGSPPRWNAQCPSCGSLERHRLLALVLRDMPLSGNFLHFAPEKSVARLLKKQNIRYVSADLYAPCSNLRLNIENIDLPNEQYDTILCSHVLEHVNDRRALPELHRVLKPSGILIVMVPVNDDCQVTYEDEMITSREEREIHFGQNDHVRAYGADFVQRLASAGFEVKIHTAFGKEAIRYGLKAEKIFLCRKMPA